MYIKFRMKAQVIAEVITLILSYFSYKNLLNCNTGRIKWIKFLINITSKLNNVYNVYEIEKNNPVVKKKDLKKNPSVF